MEPCSEEGLVLGEGVVLYPDSDVATIDRDGSIWSRVQGINPLHPVIVFCLVDGLCYRRDLLPPDLVLVFERGHVSATAFRRRDR